MAAGDISQRGFDFHIGLAENGWLRLYNHARGVARTVDFKPDHSDEAALQRMKQCLTSDPASPFANALAVFRHVHDGYFALQNDTIRRVGVACVEEHKIADADHLEEVFETEFELNIPQVADIWDKVAEICLHASR